VAAADGDTGEPAADAVECGGSGRGGVSVNEAGGVVRCDRCCGADLAVGGGERVDPRPWQLGKLADVARPVDAFFAPVRRDSGSGNGSISV